MKSSWSTMIAQLLSSCSTLKPGCNLLSQVQLSPCFLSYIKIMWIIKIHNQSNYMYFFFPVSGAFIEQNLKNDMTVFWRYFQSFQSCAFVVNIPRQRNAFCPLSVSESRLNWLCLTCSRDPRSDEVSWAQRALSNLAWPLCRRSRISGVNISHSLLAHTPTTVSDYICGMY